MTFQAASSDSISMRVSPYAKFKMSLKSKEVQRQYPNLLERFLDFGGFEGLDRGKNRKVAKLIADSYTAKKVHCPY